MIIDKVIIAIHFKPATNRTIKNIILHSTETACQAGVSVNIANSWHGMLSAPASAHYVCDPNTIVMTCEDKDIAYHCKSPMNEISIGIEMTGYAAFTKEQWASQFVLAMLDRATSLVAYKCSEHNIDAKFIDTVGLKAGLCGISTHFCVSHAFHVSDHQDPGPNFPMEFFISEVNRKLVPTSQLIPSP